MRIITLLLILLPFLSIAQINQTDSNGLRQGLWKKQQPNGRLIYEGNFKDGKPVGEWKRYHEGGQVKAIINYSGDTANTQFFDVWRKKVAEGNYINQNKEGIWCYFSKNIKVSEEQYLNGQQHGVSRKFYDTGEVMEETEWKKGNKEGKYQVFFKNGNPYMQCKMANNQRNGLCLIYFNNGKQELEAQYKNNLRHGDWKYHNEQGDFLYVLKYYEGEILNAEVRDSINNISVQRLAKGRNTIIDPGKFMKDPSEYMNKMKIYK